MSLVGPVSRTALIVGAGIGGLSAAIALRRAGWNVRVFERAASPRELGFGLLVAPNAVAALRTLGLADTVMARGFAPVRGELRRMDGRVIKRADVPGPDVLGGPMVVALRPALHGALLEAAGPECISLESEAVGFTDDGARVRLTLANGSTADGDLLVGADGSGSAIRRILHPAEPPPRRSGIVAVRGVVHGQAHVLGDCSAIYYIGPGLEAFLARASDTGIYWVLSLAETIVPAGMRDPAAILAHMRPQMDDTFRSVTAPSDDMRCDELVDREPLPFWSRGRVTLLGDAAHPLLPQTGQGAAQAMVDATALAACLATDTDVPTALSAYQRERLDRTAVLLGQGRRTARMMKMTNPVGCFIRELVIRMIPVKTATKFVARINKKAGTQVHS